MGYLFGVLGWHDAQTLKDITNATGNLQELDSKTLLLKTTHI